MSGSVLGTGTMLEIRKFPYLKEFILAKGCGEIRGQRGAKEQEQATYNYSAARCMSQEFIPL